MSEANTSFDSRFRRIRDIANADIIHETGTSKMVSRGIAAVGLFIVTFLVWAAIAKVDEITIAMGEVVPVGSVRPIQHLEGGIVSEILVQEGELVDVGTPLVRFDAQSASAELEQVRVREVALLLQQERLRAYAEDRTPDFTFAPEEFVSLVNDQNNIFESEMVSRQNQRNILVQQIAERRSELDTNREQQASNGRQVKLLQDEFEVRKKLFEDGLLSRVMYLGVQRELETAKGNGQRLIGNAATIGESIIELEQRLAELDSRLRQEALRQLGAVSSELSEVEQILSGLENRDSRLTALSPVHGLVQQIAVQAGGVVAPGGLVAEVVPVDAGFLIEGRVSTRDIGFVNGGQPVDIKVHTYDFSRYGSVPGQVISTSATTMLDESNTPFYRVRASLSQTYVGHDQLANPVFPGMTVQMDIKTGQKSILQYLLKPFYTAVNEGFRER